MKLLITDPDPRNRKMLERSLRDDFIVDTCVSAHEAEELLYQGHYDLLITETLLPDIDGEHFISLMKTYMKDLPIIAISNKTTVADKNYALSQGADDYIVKPLSILELKARINAVIRRVGGSLLDLNKTIKIRDLILDRSKRMIFYKDKRLMLRKKEMQLLEFLMTNKGRIVTRHEILENVWETSVSPYTNTVEVHLKRLRDKLEKDGEDKYIETIHGLGYTIIDEDSMNTERIY